MFEVFEMARRRRVCTLQRKEWVLGMAHNMDIALSGDIHFYFTVALNTSTPLDRSSGTVHQTLGNAVHQIFVHARI